MAPDMQYTHLNQYIAPGSSGYSDAWARVLSRLGDYIGFIVQALNIRPREVVMLEQTLTYVLVRISTPEEHLTLRIAPEGHLLCEVFFGRTAREHHLPAARLRYYDLKRQLVPFDYTIEGHVCGIGAHQIDPETPHLLRALARQVGRIMRRMHRVRVPGWGNPTATGRWLISDWHAILAYRHEKLAPLSLAAGIFSAEDQATMNALLAHPALSDTQAVLLHGNIKPQTIRCTIGDHVQLEALVDPGAVVAGDGLFDLALALNPTYPLEWRAGLLEGYAATAPLNPAERQRLQLLRLLTSYWHTCQYYARAEPHETTYEHVQTLLANVQQRV
jgi:aminoglycoside phosphotransferase (APT) family kinase protein